MVISKIVFMRHLKLKFWPVILFLAAILLSCTEQKTEPVVTPQIIKIPSFLQKKLNYSSQSAVLTASFPTDMTKVKRILMYVKLECPTGGCGAWDVYANVLAREKKSGIYYEMGRYITPYGRDNSTRARGFVFDVTDFKSILNGDTEIKIFTEVWTDAGWLVSVDFDVEMGTPDYAYYSIVPVMQFNQHSLAGIPYGETNNFKTTYNIAIPANAKETVLRTVISGWGHATPADADGRPCAEWCFRSHNIFIDDVSTFTHSLTGLGCEANAIPGQAGNWKPDRAGWCPGMEVPVRSNKLQDAKAGKTFKFDYKLQSWTNNFQSTADNKHAYYAISTFVVVKANEPVDGAIVN